MSREQQEAIESPGAWLTTVASRICLDLLGSARARRERYVGEWIPEPLPDARNGPTGVERRQVDPADRVTLDESVNMAFLVVLDVDDPGRARRVHPARRLPLLVRRSGRDRRPDACGLPPAGLVGPPAHLATRERPPTPTARQARIVRDFKRAWEAKDINALIGLLDPDATAIADGGGLASAYPHPIDGGEQIARAYLAFASAAPGS